MGRKIDELRAERAAPNPISLERLIAERVAFCWFGVNESDRQARRDGSDKRFLDACWMLAAIPFNVARQQVNVRDAPRPETTCRRAWERGCYLLSDNDLRRRPQSRIGRYWG